VRAATVDNEQINTCSSPASPVFVTAFRCHRHCTRRCFPCRQQCQRSAGVAARAREFFQRPQWAVSVVYATFVSPTGSASTPSTDTQ